MFSVAIVGVGQLGSRHLQGLAKLSKQSKFYVVDPNKNSLIAAEQRFNEVKISAQRNISYYQYISDLPGDIDLVIIATTANVRRGIIEKLLGQTIVKYLILEKVVFQRSEDFVPIQKLLIDSGVTSWVNCGRRSFQFYKRLKNEIKHEKINIKVEGNNWGLACNSIHMIDLFAFLTGRTDFDFDIDGLDNLIVDSKRNGFKELIGSFTIRTEGGDILELIDNNKYVGDMMISISYDNLRYEIIESKGLVFKHSSDLNPVKDTIYVPLQSELTGSVVDQILETGASSLTLYDECMRYHIPMLDAFNKHFTKIKVS